MFGWVLAFLSAAGNTGNDVCKKAVMARGLSPWETMALLNGFGAFLNIGFSLYTGYVPAKMEPYILWGAFFTMIGKNLAQFTYLLSLKLAPLSSVIPYLAWNPVFLLIVGALWLGEKPTFFGVVGCLVVVFGAYLISMDAKKKDDEKKKAKSELSDDLKYSNVNTGQEKSEFFFISMVKSIWAFKAGLLMMTTGIAWTYTSALEKYILKGSGIPPPYFLGLQRTFMSIPMMFYCMKTNPKFIDHTFSSFFQLAVACVVESTQILTYFWAMEYGVFVSYVIAIKRAGNIFLSVMVGRIVYKEQLSMYTIASAGCMILGVLCIVLG